MRTAIPISTAVPARKPGREPVIGLVAKPLDKVRVGIVGMGIRGRQALQRLSRVPGAEITVLCDSDPQRLEEYPFPSAAHETDWKAFCGRPDIDLVYICTPWQNHAILALEAMDCGKHVAIEVPAALTLEQIWALVDKAEQTRLHCMMLENCVYDQFERTTLEMARAGFFGALVHVEGAYHHPVDFQKEQWRLAYNQAHRGDIYPTHGFGPACRLLELHRKDRLESLVSVDAAPLTGRQLSGQEDFSNGDQTSTLLKTALGRTVLLEHNIMNPRPYSRMYQVVGTKAYAAKYPQPQVFLNGKLYTDRELEVLMAPFRTPLLPPELEVVAREVDAHGGMDYLMDYRLIQALRSGAPLDMDVYDLAEWCCVAPLSRLSLENGSAPVEVPDFTRGAWQQ